MNSSNFIIHYRDGRVEGPMQAEVIRTLLKTGRVSFEDGVTPPGGSPVPIASVAQFRALVQQAPQPAPHGGDAHITAIQAELKAREARRQIQARGRVRTQVRARKPAQAQERVRTRVRVEAEEPARMTGEPARVTGGSAQATGEPARARKPRSGNPFSSGPRPRVEGRSRSGRGSADKGVAEHAKATPSSKLSTVMPAPKLSGVRAAPKLSGVLPAPKLSGVLPAPKLSSVRPAPRLSGPHPTPKRGVRPASKLSSTRPASKLSSVRLAPKLNDPRAALKVGPARPASRLSGVRAAPKLSGVLPAPKLSGVRPAPKLSSVRPAPKLSGAQPAPRPSTQARGPRPAVKKAKKSGDHKRAPSKAAQEKQRRRAEFQRAEHQEEGEPFEGRLAWGVGSPERGLKHVLVLYALVFTVSFVLVSVFGMGEREFEVVADDPMLYIRSGLLLLVAFAGLAGLRKESLARFGLVPRILPMLVALPVAGIIGMMAMPIARLNIAADANFGWVVALLAVRAVGESVFFHGFVTRTLLIEMKEPATALFISALLYGFYALTFSGILGGSPLGIIFGIVVYGFGAGMPLAVMYWKTRSVFAPMLGHFIILVMVAVAGVQHAARFG